MDNSLVQQPVILTPSQSAGLMQTPQDFPETAKAAEVGSVFRIEQLFGSRTRARLLGLFLENSERAFFVRELARRIDAQLNAVRRELKNLVDIGIVSEVAHDAGDHDDKDEDKIDNKRFYQANKDFPIFADMRGVMKKVAVLMNHTLMQELSKHGKLDLLILTGSFTDVTTIPTDILIVGELREEALQVSISGFEKDIGREVNYTYMPREEFEYRRDVGDRFLASILQGPRIVLTDAVGLI